MRLLCQYIAMRAYSEEGEGLGGSGKADSTAAGYHRIRVLNGTVNQVNSSS